jgi:hypothetical protein
VTPLGDFPGIPPDGAAPTWPLSGFEIDMTTYLSSGSDQHSEYSAGTSYHVRIKLPSTDR